MHGPKSCRLVSGEVEGNIVITGVTQKNCQNQKRHDPNAFSRVVVPMALKQVSTKPGPCPAGLAVDLLWSLRQLSNSGSRNALASKHARLTARRL